MSTKGITAAEIAALLGGELHGDPELLLDRPAPLEEARSSEFSFSDDRGRDEAVAASAAGLVLVEDKVAARTGAQLVIAGPRAAFFRLVSERFVVRPDLSRTRIADSARLADDVVLGEGVQIGDFVSIGPGSRIGDRVQIKAGAILAEDVTIGDDSVVHALVSLRSGTRIGARVTIHDGSVIGADGFGYLPTTTGLLKVPQIGRVVIEDEVEIGAQVCIDRATLGETRIGRGSKIDNLVQIAHNVKIGPMSIIVSQVGISGSTSIGAQAMIGGQVGIVGHLKIGDRVRIGAQSGVGHDLEDGAEVLGSPAYDKRRSIRTAMTLPKLPEMRSQLRRLEERLKALEDQ